MDHCSDNKADRKLGEYWEREFCKMAATEGMSFTPMQIGRIKSAQAFIQAGQRWNCYTLPDVTVWTAPGQHHEIKHKSPTSWSTFGLEVYRFNALQWFAKETQQDVLYTIHNHALSGGRDGKGNDITHWLTASIVELGGRWLSRSLVNSWVAGEKRRVPIYYWPVGLWQPLVEYWRAPRCKALPMFDTVEVMR